MRLIEATIVTGLAGILAGLGGAGAWRSLHHEGARATARTLGQAMASLRFRAAHSGRYHALQFRVRLDKVEWRMVRDGDGDGVRKDDIREGRDVPVLGWRTLPTGFLLPGGADGEKDPFGRTIHGDQAVHFGRSGLCSVSPRGDATPGSLYFREGDVLWCLRSSGARGRILCWRKEPGRPWRTVR